MNKDEIISRIREIKQEREAAEHERGAAVIDRDAAIQARDAFKAKLDNVRNLVSNNGDGLSLTKLPSFLKSLRELIEDAKS